MAIFPNFSELQTSLEGLIVEGRWGHSRFWNRPAFAFPMSPIMMISPIIFNGLARVEDRVPGKGV